MGNPYDDYDAIDPWERDVDDTRPRGARVPSIGDTQPNSLDEHDTFRDDPFASEPDDSGSFSYVEDEYDSMHVADKDGLGDTLEHPLVEPVQTVHTEQDSFPKTTVRRYYGAPPAESPRAEPYQAPAGGILHRRRKRDAYGDAGRGASSNAGYQESPRPQAVPSPPQRQQRVRPQRPPRQRRPRRHHGCLVTLLILAAVIVGVYIVVAGPIDRKLAFTPAEQETVNGKLSFSVPGMPYYVLALGSDAREGDVGSRTDTMVLARVDFWAGKLTLVSIPRDTMVEIAGYGTQKINAAYAYGSVGGAVQAVAKLTGVPINHVAVIHFEELANLVDYLGGVTVNVPVPVYDPDYTGLVLDAGTQVLDGKTALLWARTRYGFENGDFQRQEDQRILMTAIMNRVLSLSPRELPGALEYMGDLIGTDLRCYDLGPLLIRLRIGTPTVYSCTLPATTAMVDGVSYVIVDEAALADLMQIVNAGGDPTALGY